ncbi:MAG: helix-turn-helix domain-containing protein [Microcoleaceae cyanobacterium]
MTFSTTINCDPTAVSMGISQEQLKGLIRQIETELYQSKVYRIVRAHLHKGLGNETRKGDLLMRAVGREAIQLAIKSIAHQSRLAAQHNSNPVTDPATNTNLSFSEVIESFSNNSANVTVKSVRHSPSLHQLPVVDIAVSGSDSKALNLSRVPERQFAKFKTTELVDVSPETVPTEPDLHEKTLPKTEQNTEQHSEQNPEQNSEQNPEQHPEQNSNQDIGQAPDLKPLQDSQPDHESESDSTSPNTLNQVSGELAAMEPTEMQRQDDSSDLEDSASESASPESSELPQEQKLEQQMTRKFKLKFRRKPTRAELVAQAIEQKNTCLRQIGQELQKAREEAGLSMTQLHRKTLISIAHLEALEQGEVNRLPEDVYVQSFIRRLTKVLGMDTEGMLQELPKPEPVKFNSWSTLPSEKEVYLNSLHLYLGYAALLAGALGGVAWLTEQGIPDAAPEVPDLTPNPSQTSPVDSNVSVSPDLQSTDIVLQAEIAPPEQMD